MSPVTSSALILGGQHTGLGLMRTLGRAGIPVICVVDAPQDFALVSKYCTYAGIIPQISTSYTALRAFLTTFSSPTKEFPVVFPTTDLAALHLSALINQFPQYRASIPPASTAETLIKKHRLAS
jgi:hypothetical protein